MPSGSTRGIMLEAEGFRSPAAADRHLDRGAAAPARQHAILVLAHLRQRGDEPDAGDDEEQAEHESHAVDRHAVTIVVRLLVAAFERGEIADLRGAGPAVVVV